MPELTKVICVECPKERGDYIIKDNCHSCDSFQRESGRTISCRYTFTPIGEEYAVRKEQISRW